MGRADEILVGPPGSTKWNPCNGPITDMVTFVDGGRVSPTSARRRLVLTT
jgi:hypothetical protein